MNLSSAELVVSRGFQAYREAGNALREIRSKRLWKEGGYRSFPHYCRARWQWSTTYAYNVIRAATMAEQRRAAGQPEPPSVASALRIARSTGLRDKRGRRPKPAPVPARAPVPAVVTREEADVLRPKAQAQTGQAAAPGTPQAQAVARDIIDRYGPPTARKIAVEIVKITNQRRESA